MINKNLIEEIKKINSSIIKCEVSLRNFNTMKLDAKAKYLILPTSFIELKKVLLTLRENKIKYILIGNGSNIIFTSKEKECIIKLNFSKSKFDEILFANELLMSKAGYFAKKGFEGLEYISNIPASIGGAIFMNAGAYGHFLSDIIEYIYYLDKDLNFKVIDKEKCNFTYRNSIFKESENIILGCKVRLIMTDKNALKKIMKECENKRKLAQPIEFFNSGSIFKNKDNINAWVLIEKVLLKGYKKNDAMISDKHCNFIVNCGNATSADVIYLIQLIKEKVKKELNITLEEEVIIID